MILINPETGQCEAYLTDEYILAFDILDNGFPLPVDLEMELTDQGYNVEHLYNLFDM